VAERMSTGVTSILDPQRAERYQKKKGIANVDTGLRKIVLSFMISLNAFTWWAIVASKSGLVNLTEHVKYAIQDIKIVFRTGATNTR
tara:strand:+ start:635 stop:895 length:261 start_codon:yes stop_codon:yes gene_type:complete